jgi:hypothetical protein
VSSCSLTKPCEVISCFACVSLYSTILDMDGRDPNPLGTIHCETKHFACVSGVITNGCPGECFIIARQWALLPKSLSTLGLGCHINLKRLLHLTLRPIASLRKLHLRTFDRVVCSQHAAFSLPATCTKLLSRLIYLYLEASKLIRRRGSQAYSLFFFQFFFDCFSYPRLGVPFQSRGTVRS